MGYYFFCGLLLLPLITQASLDPSRMQIQNRIKPAGTVNIEAVSTPISAPATQNKQASTTNTSPGQTTYEHHCIVCHRDGIAGAPKFRDENSWKPRLANANIDALIASAIKGKNAMPPKGTCQECSDSDIKAAIEYMVPIK